MTYPEELKFRPACPADATSIADLHAGSWRRHFRGAYSDAFLDGDVFADRLAVWTSRLQEADPRCCTMVAEDGSLAGFAHTIFDDDPTWGALLDNLHVAHGHKRRGIGSRLLALTAEAVMERPERTGLYLWVLEQNVDAQGFYQAHGGRCIGRELISPPGGNPSRLTGPPTQAAMPRSSKSMATSAPYSPGVSRAGSVIGRAACADTSAGSLVR